MEAREVSMDVEDTHPGEDFDKNISKDTSTEELASMRLAQELHEMDDIKIKIKQEELSQEEEEVKISLSEAAKVEVKPQIIEDETAKIKTESNLDLPEVCSTVGVVFSKKTRQIIFFGKLF